MLYQIGHWAFCTTCASNNHQFHVLPCMTGFSKLSQLSQFDKRRLNLGKARLGCIPNCFLTIDQFIWGVTAFGHSSWYFNQCTCMYFGIIDQIQCHENIENNNLICLKMLVHAVWIPVWISVKNLRIWSNRSVWKNCLKTQNILDFTELSTKTGKNSFKSS